MNISYRELGPNMNIHITWLTYVRTGPQKKKSHPGIGLLCMEFNETYFTGTATIITKGSCVLTCVHNVVEHDVTTKEFVYATHAWFELRKNKVGSASVLNKRYKVTKIAVYPLYLRTPNVRIRVRPCPLLDSCAQR